MKIFTKTRIIILLKCIAAVILGYAGMILALVLTQDLTLGRVTISQTPLWKILAVGVASFGSAFLGGWIAAKVYRRKNLIPQIIMSLFTMVELTLLLREGSTLNPLWFEILSESTLVAGILMGGWYGNIKISSS